jgi:hypothetical protein
MRAQKNEAHAKAKGMALLVETAQHLDPISTSRKIASRWELEAGATAVAFG